MNRFLRFVILLALLTAASFPLTAKASSRYGVQKKSKKPVLHNAVTKDGVAIEVRILSREQTKDVFGVDLLRENVQPVVIKINNEGSKTVAFHRANFNVETLSAAEAAKAAFENPIVVGGGLVKRGMGAVGRIIFPVKKAPEEKPITNSELQAIFVREELPDGDIAPDGFAQGFVFIRPLTSGQPLSLKLTDVPDQQEIVFESLQAS